MQHKLSEGPLLNERGNLNEAGYAFSLVKDYDRKAIKANSMRIKEWDYYYIGNDEYGIALTIADNSYMNLMSVSILDFKKPNFITKSYMQFFSNGKVGLPKSSKIGDVCFSSKNCRMNFYNDGNVRHLLCWFKNLKDGKDFTCDVRLTETNKDSMVIATPFDKDKHFYYNQKINCLQASGSATFDGITYSLDNCYGVLDWGRGVWTYSNTWYWASMSGIYNGNRIGFNLGYGFGNTSAATENVLFYKDRAYKLNDVNFGIPNDGTKEIDYMKPWHFTSKDGSIDMIFEPIIDRHDDTNAVVLKSLQHQVFGKFSGYIIVEGEKVEFNNMLGFAEKVRNCW